MSRSLQWLNLFGVLALAVLCAVQWRMNRNLNLEFNALEKTRQAQERKTAEQEKVVNGLTADLAHFKEQFSRAHTEATETRDKLRSLESAHAQLVSERDQLKTSVEQWSAAVTARDERLKEANARLRELGDRLNESIRKFNELATNYNAVVKELNQSRTNAVSARASEATR